MNNFDNINDGDFKIVTQDDAGNLLVGHLEIKMEEYLQKFCDYLAGVMGEEEFFDRSVIKIPPPKDGKIRTVEVVEDLLVKRGNLNTDRSDLRPFYEETYRHIYLDSFLIFTSLLGKMNTTRYGKLGKEFAERKIFKILPLSEVWNKCCKNLYIKANKYGDDRDLEAFREVLNRGSWFEYKIDYEIKFEDLKDKDILRKMDVKLSDIAYSSEILGTYNKKRNKNR